MSEYRIKIPRTTDISIADAFGYIGTNYGVTVVDVNASAVGSIGQVNLSEPVQEEWKSILEHNSYLIESMTINIRGLSVTYIRGGNVEQAQKSPIFDELIVRWKEVANGTSKAGALNIVSILEKKLNAFDPNRIISGDISEANSQLLALHSSVLERLQRVNEELIVKSEKFRENLDNKYDEKIAAAEQQFSQRDKSLHEEIEREKQKLQKEQEDLEKRLKEVDARNNTFVRRGIRDQMLNDVKARIQQFGVSKVTEDKRRPVFAGIIMLGSILAALIIWTGQEIQHLNTDGPIMYWLWFRFTLLSFGLVGTVLYYIKWANNWAHQHANAEFQLQQFYIDVNRANWAIESCLEWHKETGGSISRTLITSITKGLFTNSDVPKENTINPADTLASALMGTASKLKLKVGENELEFDRPGKISNKPIEAEPE